MRQNTQAEAPSGYARSVMALVEDYAKAVHDGDDAACVVLGRTILASLEQALPTQAEAPSEREAFEAWATRRTFNVTRHDGALHYAQHRTQLLWQAWQARAALATQQAGQGEAVGEVRAKNSSPGIFVQWYAQPPAGSLLYTTPPAPQQAEAQQERKREPKHRPEPRFGPYDEEDDTSHLMGGGE